MQNIKTILVDDEEKALKSLAYKLENFFPQIEIIDCIKNPQEAIDTINKHQPDLLFLDVEMPVLSGFDVLSKIENPSFEIIFVTAYSEYAIEAFQHCAIGYVVKPIDNDDLKLAINNAIETIQTKSSFTKNNALLETLIQSNTEHNKIIIPTPKGFSFIALEEILHFEGYDGYTKINLINNQTIISSYNLGKFEKMLNDKFYKCHKSHIVNLHKITAFENEGYIILNNTKRVPISRTKRKDFIEKLK